MSLAIVQVVAVLFALFAFSRAVLRFREGVMLLREFLLWGGIWLVVMIVALLPSTAGWFSQLLGIGRPVDAVMYVSIVVLFYLLFRMYARVEKTQEDISKIVQELALRRK